MKDPLLMRQWININPSKAILKNLSKIHKNVLMVVSSRIMEKIQTNRAGNDFRSKGVCKYAFECYR